MKPLDPLQELESGAVAPDPAASHRLFQFGCGTLAAAAAWCLYRTGGDIGIDTLLGLAILVLSSLPALLWARNRRTWFPAFEIACLTCITFYALPLLTARRGQVVFRPEVITESALLVVFYLAAANIAFLVGREHQRSPHWLTASLLPKGSYRIIPVSLGLNTLYIALTSFTNVIPFDFLGTLRALFFGIGILSTFILARLWGLGLLSRNEILFTVANLSLQVVMLFSQLYLINGISLVTLALIAYSHASRRVPWRFIVFFVPFLALLHIGKPEMRRMYWSEGKAKPTPLQVPAFFVEWIEASFERRARLADEEDKGDNYSIVERASLIQMLNLAVDRVPSIKPYLEGESYVEIPAQLVPRFLWPGKPSSLDSNVRLALHLGLVDSVSAQQVSIAFGMLAEAYMNFGFLGVILLGLAFGAAFKRAAVMSRDVPQFSALGILMILLTAWSFQVELILATWLVSLFQASIICIGLPLVYRRFTTA